MNQLPNLTTDELCNLYPNQADVIRRFINEPALMPYELNECVICGTQIESPTRTTCSQTCLNTKHRNNGHHQRKTPKQ